jgi:hypothetical protein
MVKKFVSLKIKMPRHAVGFTHIIVSLLWGVKCVGHEADHSPSSGADFNTWTYTSTSPYPFMA